MNYEQDFETVNLILKTEIETRGVDAFILSFIKCEKQARRIFTFLVFQNPVYEITDVEAVRLALHNNKKVSFRNFIKGIDIILPRPLADIYGDDYHKDIEELFEFANDRNKIFHGQVTLQGLSRDKLIDRVNHIKKSCQTLSNTMKLEIGFDGFSKAHIKPSKQLLINNPDKFDTIEKYQSFLKNDV